MHRSTRVQPARCAFSLSLRKAVARAVTVGLVDISIVNIHVVVIISSLLGGSEWRRRSNE